MRVFDLLPDRWGRRLGVLALALGQLAAGVVLPAADGHLDLEVFGAPVHVESHGEEDCKPHHDHAFCQVMRSTAMAHPGSESGALHGIPTGPDVPGRIAAHDAPLVVPELDAQSAPRAPPSA